MLTVRRAEDRGHANHGWLDTHHTFSFAGYYDPEHMGFRTLRVINDDIIAPAAGFGTHPHRDMEIITYVLSGAVEHKDSMGHGRVIHAGEFQYMAAGTGILHSEFNPSRTDPCHLLQIWIEPDHKGAKPRYEERSLSRFKDGGLHLVASKTGREGSIAINQAADIFLGRLQAGERIRRALHTGRHAWLHLAEGEALCNGQPVKGGDGVAISNEAQLELVASQTSQVLLFDLN